ncbi:fumarylacetoacetate hydrolase family protein [Gordonia lacunae]|uniref:Hydroxylase n=1 Tax=Gordonia lacunae TaxID=417102 RepID=A0A243Q5E9_9ACTN|nr:fumarylacetoacetate hydrolase family protein [Gordonia lacunae]OUC76122.1 hydroxylase [Gordonia lacunae]
MKFATWTKPDGRVESGVVSDDGLHAFSDGMTVLDAVKLGVAEAITLGTQTASTSRPVPIADVRLRPPLVPPAVRDFAAFEEHVLGALQSVTNRTEVPPEWYEAPAFYFTNPHALIGAFDDVPVPPGCEVLDFELEVAAVVTGTGASVSTDAAAELLFGYTIFNDWSARDIQAREMVVGLGPTKSKDSSSTLGPWLVTRDELEHRLDDAGFLALECSVSVNGDPIGADLLSNMAWTFPELVAHASRGTVVRSGDVLGSGTCGNGGSLAELWGVRGDDALPPLAIGDIVEMTVEGLGTIRNRVVPGPANTAAPPARRRIPPLPRKHAERQQTRT